MLNPTILIGEPLNFKGKLNIYPPTVKEVVTNPNFHVFYKLLTLTEDDIREEIGKKLKQGEKLPSPFEYLMLNCQYVNNFSALMRGAFQLFCQTDIGFLYEDMKIIIGNVEELIQTITDISEIEYLTEEEFFDFQNLVREACGDKPIKPLEPIDPNEDPRIRRIKEKARERDRIKARQAAKGKGGISLSTCLTAICCMGIGITPLNIGEMSYASVGEIMKVMQDKEKYDIDIRSLLAGADSKKVKPKYWIRNTND